MILCLHSRDFTSKIDRYLSTDWSHMIFRTRYGTKDTIMSKPITTYNIEPYVPIPINANYIIFDQEDHLSVQEENTQIKGISYLLLDEWGTKCHGFDGIGGWKLCVGVKSLKSEIK